MLYGCGLATPVGVATITPTDGSRLLSAVRQDDSARPLTYIGGWLDYVDSASQAHVILAERLSMTRYRFYQ